MNSEQAATSSLLQMLTVGIGTTNILFYEKLDLPLAEYESKIVVPVAWQANLLKTLVCSLPFSPVG